MTKMSSVTKHGQLLGAPVPLAPTVCGRGALRTTHDAAASDRLGYGTGCDAEKDDAMRQHLRLSLGLILSALLLAGSAAAQNTVTIDTAGSPTADVSDWADEVCFQDDACDDFPGQQDAKGVCIASDFATTDPSPATTAYLRFDFDERSVSGANSLDGCWLVDVNQNGNVDRALCFSLVGNPVDFRPAPDGILFFSCNDSTTTTCGGSTQVMGSSASCALNNNSVADQLLDCGDGADAAIECSITLADLGWASGEVDLIQGCSSTSAQPNSATFDCFNGLVIDPEDGGNTPVELLGFSVE
jgi:hypothetical protein